MTIRYLADRNRWLVDREYRLGDKLIKRIRKQFPTKAEAKAFDRMVDEKIKYGKAKATTQGLVAVDAATAASSFLSAWWLTCRAHFEAKRRPTTVARYVTLWTQHIEPSLGRVRLDEIYPGRLAAFQDSLLTKPIPSRRKRKLKKGEVEQKRTLRPATVRQIMALLRRMLSLAVEREVLTRHPGKAVPQVQVGSAEQSWTFLDDAELTAYLKAAAAEPPGWHAYLVLALRAGLRRGELLGLRWSAVDLANRQVTVRTTRTRAQGGERGEDGRKARGQVVEGPTKSKKARVVGLTPTAAALLAALPSRFAAGYVLTEADGVSPLDPDRETPVHRRVLTRAGITRHVRPHDLRHTWASHLAMQGVPLAVIQQLGGWASYSMVLRYAHLSKEKVVHAVDVLDRVGE